MGHRRPRVGRTPRPREHTGTLTPLTEPSSDRLYRARPPHPRSPRRPMPRRQPRPRGDTRKGWSGPRLRSIQFGLLPEVRTARRPPVHNTEALLLTGGHSMRFVIHADTPEEFRSELKAWLETKQ